jgi:hypothetical protein
MRLRFLPRLLLGLAIFGTAAAGIYGLTLVEEATAQAPWVESYRRRTGPQKPLWNRDPRPPLPHRYDKTPFKPLPPVPDNSGRWDYRK